MRGAGGDGKRQMPGIDRAFRIDREDCGPHFSPRRRSVATGLVLIACPGGQVASGSAAGGAALPQAAEPR